METLRLRPVVDRPSTSARRRDELVLSASAVRVALLLAALVLLGLVGFVQRDRIASAFAAPEGRAIDHRTYQAVFLISSQVYFGKLTLDGEVYLLTDVYYLASAPESNQPGQLIKRGTELHGPSEPMVIPARSVLYFENLRDDAQVLAAIRAFKSGAQSPAPAVPAATPSPARSP